MQLTIEANSDRDTNLYFPPLSQTIRGRFDATRLSARNPNAATVLSRFPQPIPGQKISIDTQKRVGTIEEPLHDLPHKDTRKRLAAAGFSLKPRTQQFDGVDVAAWLFCMRDAVDGGLAQVVEGKMPAVIDGKRPKSFVSPDQPDENETLRQTLVENAKAMREAVEAIRDLATAMKGK